MVFKLQFIPATVAVGIVGLVLFLLLKKCSAPPPQKRIVLCGLANAGKTKLYMYLNTQEVPETVTSAQITRLLAHFDANPEQRCELVDVPSDERLQSSFDFATAGRIVFMAPDHSREAVQRLAQLLTKIQRNCQVMTNVMDASFREEVEREYARVNGMDEMLLPWEIEQVEINFADKTKLDKAAARVMANL